MSHSDQSNSPKQLTIDGRSEPVGGRARRLTKAQREGLACVVCARADGHMIPLRQGPSGQLFAHLECAGTKQ